MENLYKAISKRYQYLCVRKLQTVATKEYLDVQGIYSKGISGNCTSDNILDCFNQACPTPNPDFVDLMGIDFKEEHKLGIGTRYKGPKFLGPAQVHLPRKVADKIEAKLHEWVMVRIDLSVLSLQLWDDTMLDFLQSDDGDDYTAREIYQWRYVYVPFKIAFIYDDPGGLFAKEEDEIIIVNRDTLLEHIGNYFNPDIPQSFNDRILRWKFKYYADQVIFNYPKDKRVEWYIKGDFDEISSKVVKWSSKLMYQIGFNMFFTQLPVLNNLEIYQFLGLFLGLILNVIIAILMFLSIILIYSLLNVSVETRQYELGVFRMIGMYQLDLVVLLLIQAALYSIPACVVGIFVAEGLVALASVIFHRFTDMYLNFILSVDSVIYAIILGISIPIIAAIMPIRLALTHQIHESIDLRRSKVQAIVMQLDRANDQAVSFPLLIVGLFCWGFGFMVYYLIPLSLLGENFGMLLNVFFLTLLMMLLGSVLMAMNFTNLLEGVVVSLCLWPDQKAVRSLVMKNLIAHRIRNQKTTLLYAVSISFILFIVVSYHVEVNSVVYELDKMSGTMIKGIGNIKEKEPFESWAEQNEAIESYSWMSVELNSLLKGDNPRLTTIGHSEKVKIRIYGVSPNLFETLDESYIKPAYWNGGDPVYLTRELYTANGSATYITGSLYYDELSMRSLDTHTLLETASKESTHLSRLKPTALMDSAPAFLMSPFIVFQRQDFICSLQVFLRLCNSKSTASIDDIPMRKFFIKFKEDVKETHIKSSKAELKQIMKFWGQGTVKDFRDDLESLDLANTAMSFFFGFAIVIAMMISFFSLVSSMYSNIEEQRKEIGILRSLGMPVGILQRVYVYEAFVIVLSSSLLGVIIGTTIGWTVSMQQGLFTQVPIPFSFPLQLLALIIGLSVVCAIASAYSPITLLLRNEIVSILRG